MQRRSRAGINPSTHEPRAGASTAELSSEVSTRRTGSIQGRTFRSMGGVRHTRSGRASPHADVPNGRRATPNANVLVKSDVRTGSFDARRGSLGVSPYPSLPGPRRQLLQTLYDVRGTAGGGLPREIIELYDGGLRLDSPVVFGNFVSSMDGVVALPSVHASPSVISGKSEADKFVMGLLRASADVVLVGAGTVRAEPQHRWTPEFICPQLEGGFARLRAGLGLSAQPRLAVLTSRGDLEPELPGLDGALVITTARGAARLRNRGLSSAAIMEAGEDVVDLNVLIERLRAEGHGAILSEGGPTVIGQLLERALLDELFLTISPVAIGRTASQPRPGLVEGVDLLRDGPRAAELLSVRRHRSHLFVRYSFVGPRREQRLDGA
jgi:riboflavin biosynthesis pyrimidine reductase